ncbi:hypothetical protein OG21DRAFT_913935 [Imleria badia]|nr:hypothetical protein OG21DRAFT_913935 [Imleria badia]
MCEVSHTLEVDYPPPPKKHHTAVGFVVDGGSSRFLDSIFAISDIPEVESHKLSELCRILALLEGLFVENTREVNRLLTTQLVWSLLIHPIFQSSFVVSYIPSWLKTSYLSELLEASMADLSSSRKACWWTLISMSSSGSSKHCYAFADKDGGQDHK